MVAINGISAVISRLHIAHQSSREDQCEIELSEMPIDIPAFAYAVAVAGGGVLGYVKSSEFYHV